MFEKCFQDKEFKQALGIALESKRLDVLEECIVKSGNETELLSYCFDLAMTTVTSKDFRGQVLSSIIKIFKSLKKPDFFRVVQCYLFLNEPVSVGEVLLQLCKGEIYSEDECSLISRQIAFDLFDRSSQHFLYDVKNVLTKTLDDSEKDEKLSKKIKKLLKILSGEKTISLYVDFLYRHNHTDISILKNIKVINILTKGFF
jgi:26S proteasome regulatory subunit N2